MIQLQTQVINPQYAQCAEWTADYSTQNKSFLTMHFYLKEKGISNNNFMLMIFDKGLIGVDPFDPNLSPEYKARILIECQRNFWYFIREIVRMTSAGGAPVRFNLDRANMAMAYLLQYSINVYEEIPRQCGKTLFVAAWYLWLYNFRTRSSNIVFLNKKMETTKENLDRLKTLRDGLPEYLRMSTVYDTQGKPLKSANTVEYIKHPINKNMIKCLPSATSEGNAANLLRGKSLSGLWVDEAGFIPHLRTILINGMPALRTSMDQCAANGAPHGIIYTSTPGSLKDPDAAYFNTLREAMTPFQEAWYNLSPYELLDLIKSNPNSSFVYVKFDYKQLGKSEQWFKDNCKEMCYDYVGIRRELLLMWESASDNCPYSKEQLDVVQQYTRNPIKTMLIFNKYPVNFYKEFKSQFELYNRHFVVGCDVAAGTQRDSSTMVVLDARTSELILEFNCNYISTIEFAKVIIEVVTKWLPMDKCLVTVERNGVGHGVLSRLINSPIKRCLYYEIKEKVVEERGDAGRMKKCTEMVKSYGLYNINEVRYDLMDLLSNRIENYPHLITSKTILEEIRGLERKKGDRIEHSSVSHDDTVFGYLIALYPLYYGKKVAERWGLEPARFKTLNPDDDDYMLDSDETATEKFCIAKKLATDTLIENNEELAKSIEFLQGTNVVFYEDFWEQQRAADEENLRKVLATPTGRAAYMNTYHISEECMNAQYGELNNTAIPDSVFSSFYEDD